jgi:hypothetical protein
VRHGTGASVSDHPQANFKAHNVKAHATTDNRDAHTTPGPVAASDASSLVETYNFK